MTNGTHIQFKTIYTRSQDAAFVADHGAEIEVRVWARPSSKFQGFTKRIPKNFVTRVVGPLKGQMATEWKVMGA